MSNPLDDVQLHRVDTLDDANAFMRWLGERRPGPLAVDTETTGLKPWRDRVRLVQFGDPMQGWTIRWSDWAGLAKQVFARYEGRYVFHNASYDVAMLKHSCGIDVPTHRVDDTMIMAHVLDSSRRVGLKTLSAIHVDGKSGVAQAMLDHAMTKHGWGWDTIPYEVPIYSVYAAMDTVLTARMHDILEPTIRADCPRAYDLELAFAFAVMRMENRGVALDMSFTERQLETFDAYVKQATDWCVKNYGVKPGSNDAVIDRLREDGIVIEKYTCGCVGDEQCDDINHKTKLALDKDVLGGIIKMFGHPLAQVVLQRRRAQKLATTYLKNFIKNADGDGIIRPDMYSLGARTGRMSITDPPLQTLPRRSSDNELAIVVRNCIVSREDNVLMMSDFDQIEMRMLADLARDPGLAAAFGEGDFFTNMCRQIFHDDTIVKKDPRRQTTKNAMYAKAYGSGIPKFSLTAGIPVTEGRDFMMQLDSMFPGIRRLQDQVRDVARQRLYEEGRAYVRSPLTGRRHFCDANKIYALVNYLIQGGAAEVLKMKTLELEAAGVGDYTTLLVHDEVIADTPKAVAHEVARTMDEVMNDDKLFSVALTATTELGYRWGEKGNVTLEELAA